LPEPVAITTEEALGGEYDCRRVTMEGLLVQAPPSAQQPTLVLRSADTVFQAELADTSDPALLIAVKEGSWLRLKGICVNTRGEDLFKGFPPGLQERPRPAAFHLLVASPSDVTVLRTPSWWTVQRVLVALGVILAVALAAIAWVVVLRYRVAVQTNILRRQLAREAVYEERARIARELHDTLEQALGGISFQLHAVGKNLPHAPDAAQQVLDVARSLLKYSRAEARRSIADLRASLLEDGDLAAALRTVAAQADRGSTTAVEAVVAGQPRRLPGEVETNLLRIAQEALANALEHGKPARVKLTLSFGADEIALRILDDGIGFEVEQAMAVNAGHFGLLGMRERTEKVGGCFTVRSASGQGTEVVVAVKIADGSHLRAPKRGSLPDGEGISGVDAP
jgi:signal transduction histidine kinase